MVRPISSAQSFFWCRGCICVSYTHLQVGTISGNQSGLWDQKNKTIFPHVWLMFEGIPRSWIGFIVAASFCRELPPLEGESPWCPIRSLAHGSFGSPPGLAPVLDSSAVSATSCTSRTLGVAAWWNEFGGNNYGLRSGLGCPSWIQRLFYLGKSRKQ